MVFGGMEAVTIGLGEKEYYEFICCDMGVGAEGRLSR